ncbi:ATPase [Prauserella marina]|uniref:Uncharacterized conserved protein YndB, AHSA1/START domain n=1 Tax=Prauserella marina TaxID=530584 RepID=A0A222VTP5_9PSEU|nr:SRPBCC family protein [Prauserella marina]ASR37091.1 ATPase [Prauserella marina]PWV79924.1 uncharacterized protein YndB with AHSA1/START domain [Prauserella marina]SDD86995.1 Uncharacterized conserved protein YndB, AHSA1/START domain [Prauserella marina]
MSPQPSGNLFRTADGHDLVLDRTFRAPATDVWAALTEPERTARWFGPWEGTPGAGGTVKVRLVHEEGQPWYDLRIDACEPPGLLALSSTDDNGTWHLTLTLAEANGTTTLRFTQHLTSADGVAEIGPGWEYYLDLLVAAHEGTPLPAFTEYYPAQRAYYLGLGGSGTV